MESGLRRGGAAGRLHDAGPGSDPHGRAHRNPPVHPTTWHRPGPGAARTTCHSGSPPTWGGGRFPSEAPPSLHQGAVGGVTSSRTGGPARSTSPPRGPTTSGPTTSGPTTGTTAPRLLSLRHSSSSRFLLGFFSCCSRHCLIASSPEQQLLSAGRKVAEDPVRYGITGGARAGVNPVESPRTRLLSPPDSGGTDPGIVVSLPDRVPSGSPLLRLFYRRESPGPSVPFSHDNGSPDGPAPPHPAGTGLTRLPGKLPDDRRSSCGSVLDLLRTLNDRIAFIRHPGHPSGGTDADHTGLPLITTSSTASSSSSSFLLLLLLLSSSSSSSTSLSASS
ncbi:unnamed protein product [Pleuronectes platessa]|uniref:Uncharacterized protein n=1 Tax=Pleuronectes platessa TaxID=8262 RepID=A0A9N7V484_PLEPL|nr:unnamed protein product [Pleuronectes platessa]